MAAICIDAGHGGADPGAVWQNIREKDLNLVYALALDTELKKHGYKILMTRKNDTNVPPLLTRCRLINAHHQQKAPYFDAIISLHCNVAVEPNTLIANPRQKGLYVIYSAESERSIRLAETIAEQCGKDGFELNHQGLLSTVELGRSLAWIHKTLPTSVLVEMGFMTHPEELLHLQSDQYRSALVQSLAKGLSRFVAG